MELEDLKNRWSSLEDQLQKQEMLNTSIMKGLLHTKSDKALSRLINYELFGLIVILLIIPLIIHGLSMKVESSFYYVFHYVMIGVCLVLFVWKSFKMYDLTHIDLSKTVSNNIRYANKYNIKIRKEKMGMLFLVPFLSLSCIYLYAKLNANFILWVFMTCAFICAALITFWGYKKIYGKSIASILQSLDELKELEED